jgi:hypothetical protein
VPSDPNFEEEKAMKCINCGERENYRDWDMCKICTGLAIQQFVKKTDTVVMTILDKLTEAAKKATPGPWMIETQQSDFGGEYITGHITSPHHNYAGNRVERTDSIMSPGTMTLDDAEYLVLCAPENILLLIKALIRG